MYQHCNGIHKLLQTLATNQGVPMDEIPPPPIPPPAHSPSPDQSPVQTMPISHESEPPPPVLCAQQPADPSFYDPHNLTSHVPLQDLDAQPEAMFVYTMLIDVF